MAKRNSSFLQSQLPFEIESVDDQLNHQLLADIPGERTGFVQIGADKWFMPIKYREHAFNYFNFDLRPDDIWIVTFPRSGTTLTQELVWLVANNCNFQEAQQIPQVQRFPFLEFNALIHDQMKRECQALFRDDTCKQELLEHACRPGYELLNEMKSPRFIKTHLPFSLLPPALLDTCKVIYVARNPKDVAVSYYHLYRLFRTMGYTGDFHKFWEYFTNNLVYWSPYWKHVQEGWQRRHHRNMKFLFYENMSKDLKSTICEVAHFLNKSINETQVAKLAEYLNISNFRNNSSVNLNILREIGMMNNGEEMFIRKGKTGTWSTEFTAELNQQADNWITENLKKTDLRFPEI